MICYFINVLADICHTLGSWGTLGQLPYFDKFRNFPQFFFLKNEMYGIVRVTEPIALFPMGSLNTF